MRFEDPLESQPHANEAPIQEDETPRAETSFVAADSLAPILETLNRLAQSEKLLTGSQRAYDPDELVDHIMDAALAYVSAVKRNGGRPIPVEHMRGITEFEYITRTGNLRSAVMETLFRIFQHGRPWIDRETEDQLRKFDGVWGTRWRDDARRDLTADANLH
jgi:hypothetical protein